MTILLRLTLGLMLAGGASSAAHAYACAVKPTSDGFVALRSGPSAKHPEIARMKAHEFIGLLDEQTDDVVREGNWVRVTWYRGTRRTAFHTPDVSTIKGRTGWMNDRYVNCFQ